MASTPDQQVAKEEKFFFGSSSISSLSFQSVASSSLTSSPFGQKPSNSSPGFAGAGSPVFASQGATDHDDSVTGEDHDGPHFEPIIPLPDKIDVKTGEEDEEVMFSHRAKLYQFVAEDKQWKERGVGEIKLLRNRQSGKMRVLMRRDQVLKICANHQITTDMKLQPNAGSEKSWVWSTLADFSEQECKAEQLAVRFKSEDIAKQFKEKFEECQEMLRNQTSSKSIQEGKRQEEAKEDLFAKFKAAEGSWECDICMVPNDSDKVECVACGSSKPGAEPPSQGQNKDRKPLFAFGSATPSTGSGFSFASTGKSQGDKKLEAVKDDLFAKFKAAEGSWECDICMVPNDSDKVECVACGSLKPGAEPLQGERKDMKPPFLRRTTASSTPSGFTFGMTTPSGFTFASAIPSTGMGSLFGSSALSSNSGNSLGSVGTPLNRIKRSVRRYRQ